ncbi:MAG: DNA adenine methylase [Fibromonadaceae bacterium]|jgi:DNA adenine methylase|nr:DNA adenine methylase [Fibromonadaceae bacterium]
MKVAVEQYTRKMPPPIMRMNKPRKLIAFGWYGGKFSHLDWLLPQLPDCSHYCEPFAGSGAVLLNKKPSPVETYNDIDGEVVNFFKVLREEKETLIEKIALTPFSREEFGLACELNPKLSDLERARRFYIRARQVRTGLAQTATIGRWANCKNTSRAGMSGVVSRWLGGVKQLEFIAERFLRVQIENRPAIDVIKLYDSENTLFYCDPPYIHETRGDTKSYGYEMDDSAHRELAKVLNSAKGHVAISNYECDLMEELYPSEKWTKIYSPEKIIHSTKDLRQEVLWVNYDLNELSRQNLKSTFSLFAYE